MPRHLAIGRFEYLVDQFLGGAASLCAELHGHIGFQHPPLPVPASAHNGICLRASPTGSKPVTTIGMRYVARDRFILLVAHYGQTCPAARKPCTRLSGDRGSPLSRAEPVTWETTTAKLPIPRVPLATEPSRWPARWFQTRLRKRRRSGGLSLAPSSGSPAVNRRFATRRRCLDGQADRRDCPAHRSMSPNEQKITSSRAAISIASSISSNGVTQTGHPGPWN